MAILELEHELERDADVTFVALAGELDLTNAEDLDERLGAIASGRPLVLDVNRLVFVDSAALHRLFRIVRERGPRGVAFVVDPSAPVAATLGIVEMGRAAPVVPTREAAVAAVGRGRSERFGAPDGG